MKKILSIFFSFFVVGSLSVSAAVDSGKELTAQFAAAVPVVDGEIDDIWQSTQKIEAWSESSRLFANGYAKILWTKDTLYLMAEVTDSTVDVGKNNTSNEACFWVSETASNANEYDGGDWNISINQSGVYEYYSGTNLGNIASYASIITDKGYVVELAVPVQTKNYSYKVGEKISFCLSIEDDIDGDNVRDWVCASQDTNYWYVPANLYEVTLIDRPLAEDTTTAVTTTTTTATTTTARPTTIASAPPTATQTVASNLSATASTVPASSRTVIASNTATTTSAETTTAVVENPLESEPQSAVVTQPVRNPHVLRYILIGAVVIISGVTVWAVVLIWRKKKQRNGK